MQHERLKKEYDYERGKQSAGIYMYIYTYMYIYMYMYMYIYIHMYRHSDNCWSFSATQESLTKIGYSTYIGHTITTKISFRFQVASHRL